MSFVITILSQKGAQHKTSASVNLAAALAQSGRGFVIDLDAQQGDATRYKGSIDGVEWLETLPKVAPNGFTVVDTAPQITPDTGAALLLSRLVLIPCTPHAASLESLARTFETIELARKKRPELTALVAFTGVDRSQYAAGVIAAARILSQWPVAETTIPARVMDFERAYQARRPVVLSAPKSAGATAYRALAREIEAILK